AIGVPYTATLDVHGGDGQTILVNSSGLPPGLTAHASQPDIVISGTPTQPGTFQGTVTAEDVLTTYCGVFHFTITVAGAPFNVLPLFLFDGAVGLPYTQKFTALGSAGPFTFGLIGAPPPGLTLAGDTISGTPTQPGSFSFGLSISSASGSPSRADYTLLVTATPKPRLEVTMTDGGVPWGSIPYDADEDNGPKIPYAISVLNLGTAPATGMILHLLLDGTLVPNGGTSGCGVSEPGRQQAVDLPQGFLDAQE